MGQQVGVGTSSPTERLDVNGNVNVRGQLKINGQGGQPGQVLQMGANGLQQWTSAFGYKNRREFFSAGTFTVPAGVREIMIDAVGAGGGGAKGGGGAGGGRGIAVVKVAPGQVFNITVGLPGAGSTTELGFAQSGFPSEVTGPAGLQVMGEGGGQASTDNPGEPFVGPVVGDSVIYMQAMYGQPGELTIETFQQRTATEYITVRQYGNGGASPLPPYSQQKGAYFAFNTATLLNLRLVYSPSSDSYGNWGSGGAGGNTRNGQWGSSGQRGRVAIMW